MSTEQIDALLERMPKIASAVNAFQSEIVQQEAFVALIAAFNGNTARKLSDALPGIKAALDSEAAAGEEPPTSEAQQQPAGNANGRKRKKVAASKADWTLVRDLDLHPAGKQSFESFAEEKQAKSMEDRYAVVVYYLQEILGRTPVTKNDVGSVFRLMPGWQEPSSVQSGLRTASSRKGTVVSSDMEDISLTPTGRNFVEHRLPPKGSTK